MSRRMSPTDVQVIISNLTAVIGEADMRAARDSDITYCVWKVDRPGR